MHCKSCLLLFALLLCAGLAAQPLSGNYSIPGNYKTFTAAAAALQSNGVSGPVTFVVVPGTYTESFSLPPVQGASSTNTITFRSIIPGKVQLKGASGDTVTFATGTSNQPTAWYVLEGIEFTSGPGYAIKRNKYCHDIEIKECIFRAAHGSSSTTPRLWYVDSKNFASRWKVHHNEFAMPANGYGLYLSQISYWEFHHNTVDLNGCRRGMFFINNNRAYNRIYNNLFFGTLAGGSSNAALHVAASNYENEITHNTFLVKTTSGNAIFTQGWNSGINHILSNIIMVIGGGNCLRVYRASGSAANLARHEADNNIYWAPGGTVGYWDRGYGTLKAWLASGAAGYNQVTGGEKSSLQTDPRLVKATAPFDLRIRPGSPAKDAATRTPTYVKGDFAGNLRDATPDLGAYELSAFKLFGTACAGSGNVAPEIGYSGTAAIGGTNFAVTLGKALGGAGAIMALGTSSQSWGAITLPFPLGGGCDLNVRITLPFPATAGGTGAGNGTASQALPIPNDPALAGGSFYMQWLVLDPQAPSNYGVVVTRGASLTL